MSSKTCFAKSSCIVLASALFCTSLPALATSSTAGTNLAVQQQDQKLKGQVIDATTGEPVIGVNVLVKGSTNGTITDIDGKYELNAPAGAILQISFIGYKTVEIAATTSEQTIKLHEDTETLDEVVVVGYGVQKKESLTGAMSTLKENRLKDVTTPTVENMLNGKVSGVYVAPGSGQPGSNGAVQIRGRATLSGSTSPLWVIDGVIVGEDPGVLNPSDIENMTILKDAASTAIYGSQGANGVIIVTTKMGKSEKMKINASVKLGVSTMTNGKMEVMNGAELYDYYASFPNQEDIKFSRWNPELRNANFDWGELASQAGFTQDYNISLSGGNEKMSSYFSLGYYSEEGTVKGYKYDRYSFRYRSNYKPFSWLTIKPNISGSMKNTDDSQYDYTAKYTMFPWDSPYDEDGNLVPDRYSGWVDSSDLNYLNSISYGNHTARKRKTYEFSGNFDFDIKITDWLTFTSVNNYRWTGYFQSTYADPRTDSASGVQGRVEEEQTNNIQRYTNQYLTFNKIFGKHSVQALLAYEFMDTSAKVINAKGTGIVSGFEVLDATATPEEVGGNLTEWAKQSVFAKANYTYDNRYLAEVSLRRDGASNFGDDKKYGNFFSISGGWNINREKWFKADWVDVLKLRASYGSVGNIPYSKYPQYGLYSVSSNYNGIPAILISQVGNKDLTWEQTYTAGVGIDANFFNNRLRFVFDYYNKYTSNILYQVPVSGLTGITSRWQNVGEMRNSGIEITIGGDIIRTKDWLWSLDLNMGYNKNKLEKLYGDDPNMMIIGGGGNDTSIAGAAEKVLKVGYSTDRYYLREWAGVDPKNGAPLWYKNDGSGETTSNYSEAKQVMTEATSPKLFGGFNTSLTWKNIDLNASFGFSLGGKIYNYSRQEYDSDGAYTDRNQMKLIDGWSRWEKEGDIATHPAASYGNKSNSNKASTRYLEDGDYLKLRSLSIGYNLNLSKYYIQNMRIYFTAENVFTLTGFSGIDPEVPAYYDETTGTYKSIGTAGANLYPSTRKFMFGINLTF